MQGKAGVLLVWCWLSLVVPSGLEGVSTEIFIFEG